MGSAKPQSAGLSHSREWKRPWPGFIPCSSITGRAGGALQPLCSVPSWGQDITHQPGLWGSTQGTGLQQDPHTRTPGFVHCLFPRAPFGQPATSSKSSEHAAQHLGLLLPCRELLTHPVSGSDGGAGRAVTHGATLVALTSAHRVLPLGWAGPQAHTGGCASCAPVQPILPQLQERPQTLHLGTIPPQAALQSPLSAHSSAQGEAPPACPAQHTLCQGSCPGWVPGTARS